MTTAELIKKREDAKNKPAEQTIPSFQYKSNTTFDDEQLGVSPVVTEQPEEKTLLYDAGKAAQGVVKTPVSTDETNAFYKAVFTPEDFGVETPEQAAARERRDFIKQGLTGFTEGLSALANLYYTTKGAPSQKLTSQMPALQQRLYQERLERDKKLENFRAWQRAKADKEEERAYNLSLFNLKQEAADKAAEKKAKYEREKEAAEREFKVLFEGLQQTNKKEMAELNDKLRKGQISYQEAVKLANKIAYDNTSGGGSGKVVDSVIGSDGTVLTRNSRLTDNEMRQLVIAYVDDLSPWTKIEEDELGNVKKGTVDYREAFADAAESGLIPSEVLEQMGFKKLKTEKKGKSLPGVEPNNKKGKHLNL